MAVYWCKYPHLVCAYCASTLCAAEFIYRENLRLFSGFFNLRGRYRMTGVQAKLEPHWGVCSLGVLQVCCGFNPQGGFGKFPGEAM
jgi:hypothetical protein